MVDPSDRLHSTAIAAAPEYTTADLQRTAKSPDWCCMLCPAELGST